mgnify:CR=1 FL=1
MVGTDPAPFGAGTSEPHVTLDTSHHAGGLRPIESMAAAQMQQLETNVGTIPSAETARAAAVSSSSSERLYDSTARESIGRDAGLGLRTVHGAFAFRFGGNLQPQH